MKRVVVEGALNIVDSAVIAFLQKMKKQYDQVWVYPTSAKLSPAVNLHALRYVLRQLLCVDKVITSRSSFPTNVDIVCFPTEITNNIQKITKRIIHDEKQIPKTWTVDKLLTIRPFPLILLTGCFDLIHSGHVRSIEIATQYGSEPVVAMLTTKAIRSQPKNIGRKRPLWTMSERITFMRELRSQPRIIFFDGKDSLQLINQLRPNFYLKETRDQGRQIIDKEARLVEEYNGQTIWIDSKTFDTSTTTIENAILTAYPRTKTILHHNFTQEV